MTLKQTFFTNENHHVRRLMCERQLEKIHASWRVSQIFINWIACAALCIEKIPNVFDMSKRLEDATWWKLCTAENHYLSNNERFTHLVHKEFPVTDYIRPMKDINYTTMPDLFHEYFGHMPQMFQQQFADIEHKTALLHFKATTKEQQQRLFNISWRTIEYGVLYEGDQTKAIGAWILSSPGDLRCFCEDGFSLIDATLEWLMHTSPSPHKQHELLFVCSSIQQWHDLLDEFESKYL